MYTRAYVSQADAHGTHIKSTPQSMASEYAIHVGSAMVIAARCRHGIHLELDAGIAAHAKTPPGGTAGGVEEMKSTPPAYTAW